MIYKTPPQICQCGVEAQGGWGKSQSPCRFQKVWKATWGSFKTWIKKSYFLEGLRASLLKVSIWNIHLGSVASVIVYNNQSQLYTTF